MWAMRFLKTVFWTILAVIAVLFATTNWTPVTITIWNGVMIDTWLPLLLLIAFFIGLLPTLLWHRASRWGLNRKLDSLQRALADAQKPPAADEPQPPLPPIATPMAVPPGVL
jgi:lipopolysaccharide assembly protein A